MVSFYTVVLLLHVSLSAIQKVAAMESVHSKPDSCIVCWSLKSAEQCQNSSKTEACSLEELNSTMNKIRLIDPSALTQNQSADNGKKEKHIQFRCFTLSAVTTGKIQPKKTFYAKGCATTTSDPCTGWEKEKGASCSLCSGSNCNGPLPSEAGNGSKEKNKIKFVPASNSNTATKGDHYSYTAGFAIASILYVNIFL